jgi:hypothetical protein
MSTKDADRVKEHTGVDPEELEDDELATAMSELGIEQQKVTDADRTLLRRHPQRQPRLVVRGTTWRSYRSSRPCATLAFSPTRNSTPRRRRSSG